MIAEKPQLQIVTSWDRLRQLLLKAIDRQRYHFGYVFDRVEQVGSGVRVHFANGRSEEADVDSRPRRRGDQITTIFAALHMSAFGT